MLTYKADLSNIQSIAESGGKINSDISATSGGGGWYSQTVIKNNSTEDRKIISIQAIYDSDGNFARIMNNQLVYTVPANGGSVTFSPNDINSDSYSTFPNNATIKIFFLDAETVKPLTKSLEIVRNYTPAS